MKHFPERLWLSLLTVAHKHLPDSDTTVFFFCIPTCQRTIVGAFAYHRLTCNHVLHNSRIVRINSRFPSQTRRITNDLKYHQHRTRNISMLNLFLCAIHFSHSPHLSGWINWLSSWRVKNIKRLPEKFPEHEIVCQSHNSRFLGHTLNF